MSKQRRMRHVGSMIKTKTMRTKFCSENVKVRAEFEDIRITKRWVLKNHSVRIGAGLILFRISFIRSCDCGHEPLGCIKFWQCLDQVCNYYQQQYSSLRVFTQIYSTILNSLTQLCCYLKATCFGPNIEHRQTKMYIHQNAGKRYSIQDIIMFQFYNIFVLQ